MIKNVVRIICVVLFQSLGYIECKKPLMCYIAAYSVYRPEPAKFTPEHVDPHLCTHIIYAHLGIAADSADIIFTDSYADTSSGLGLVAKVAGLKKKNPSLKLLFSLGGWNVGSVKFSKVASSKDMRRAFAQNIVTTLKTHNFDGIDMNWMYPNHRGGKPEDKANYVQLLKEVKEEVKKHGYLLVALMSGNEYVYKRAYDVKAMSQHLDYILLLTYDYHGFWDGRTGVFAPLKYFDTLSVTSTVEEYLKSGVDSEKLILGFATHGRTFQADNDFKNTNFFGVPAKRSFTTAWTKEEGYMGFNEICHELENNLWTVYWDPDSSTPFATSGRRLISYEDEISFKSKINYLKEKKLGGAMLWSLDTDDFNGKCAGKKYPLTSVIKAELDSYSTPPKKDEYAVKMSEKITAEDDESEEDFTRSLKLVYIEVRNFIHN